MTSPPITTVPSYLTRYASRIRATQILSVLGRMPTLLFADFILGNGLIVGLLVDLPATYIACWVTAHTLVDAIGIYVYMVGRNSMARERHDAASWIITIGFLLLGAYWGAFGAYMYSFSKEWLHLSNTFLLIASVDVLAVAVLGDYLPVLAAFLASSMPLLATRAVVTGDFEQVSLGVFGMLGVVFVYLMAKAKNNDTVQSIGARFAVNDVAAELAEQRDAANRANIAKSKFIAAASHDLRQPLHALTLMTKVLEESPAGTDTGSITKDIQSSIGSLETLFNALLDLSQLDAGILQPRLAHFELDKLLRRIGAEYAIEAEGKGLRLLCEPCALIAHTDPLLLERILRNYLANAVRYTEQGSIRVRGMRSGGELRIEVIDTGAGIPQAEQTAIFDEYFQLENPERDRDKGLGLGLAIARRIAKLLDHRIGVESALGQGSCFFVAVPEGDRRLASCQESTPIPTINLAGLRVVVIDDDSTIRASMRKLLTLWGCDCIVVESESDAVSQARERFAGIDAIVADYRLRENRNGLDAVEKLRHEFVMSIPALLVSGDTAPERLREVAAHGYQLVHKPVQLPVLKVFLANAQRTLLARQTEFVNG